MVTNNLGAFSLLLGALLIIGCRSVDMQLIDTSSIPSASLKNNGTYELIGCHSGLHVGQMSGGQFEMPRKLPPEEARIWLQKYGLSRPLPYLNQAFSFDCGKKIGRISFHKAIYSEDQSVEIWIYSDESSDINRRITEVIDTAMLSLDRARQRLGISKLRIILAAACSSDRTRVYFSFRGIFDRDVPTTRGVAIFGCATQRSESNYSDLEYEVLNALATAVHEAVHGVLELRFSPRRDEPFVQLTDEMIAVLFTAEFLPHLQVLLPVSEDLVQTPVSCDFSAPSRALIEGFDFGRLKSALAIDEGSLLPLRMSSDYGTYIGLAAYRLSGAIGEASPAQIAVSLTPQVASNLLDKYGVSLDEWKQVLSTTLACR